MSTQQIALPVKSPLKSPAKSPSAKKSPTKSPLSKKMSPKSVSALNSSTSSSGEDDQVYIHTNLEFKSVPILEGTFQVYAEVSTV